MRMRRLGRHGPEISVLGFGSWAAGGPWRFGWGSQDDGDSVEAIHRALDGGVNWIDTAAVYGRGHSEEVVGRALREAGTTDGVFVFTKCGRVWDDEPDGEIVNDLRPDSIRFECEQSLKRLGIERIDLYQFHWPDPRTGTEIEDSWATMGALIQEGKVRWGGVSNFDVTLLERCDAVRRVDSMQPPLSLIRPEAVDGVIPWCRQHGTGVIVYSPMQAGLLTGAFDAARVRALAADDWRRQGDQFLEPNLSKNLALVDRLRPIADDLGTSLAELSIAWAIAVPGVTGAIVGARNPGQVNAWLAAGDLELDADALARIAEASTG